MDRTKDLYFYTAIVTITLTVAFTLLREFQPFLRLPLIFLVPYYRNERKPIKPQQNRLFSLYHNLNIYLIMGILVHLSQTEIFTLNYKSLNQFNLFSLYLQLSTLMMYSLKRDFGNENSLRYPILNGRLYFKLKSILLKSVLKSFYFILKSFPCLLFGWCLIGSSIHNLVSSVLKHYPEKVLVQSIVSLDDEKTIHKLENLCQSKEFRKQIFNDQVQWNRLTELLFAEIKSFTDSLSAVKSELKPLIKLDDERNRINYLEKKEAKSIVKKPTGLLEDVTNTAKKYFVEDVEIKHRVTAGSYPDLIPEKAAPAEGFVPSVLLPKKTAEPKKVQKLKPITKSIPGATELLQSISKIIDKLPLGKYFLDETLTRENSILFYKDHTTTIKTVKSKDEDLYGRVQQDIPTIISLFLDLHSALLLLIETQKRSKTAVVNTLFELPPIIRSIDFNWKVFIINEVDGTSFKMVNVVENSIYQLVLGFYTQFDRFVFNEQYKGRLQRFMDFMQ